MLLIITAIITKVIRLAKQSFIVIKHFICHSLKNLKKNVSEQNEYFSMIFSVQSITSSNKFFYLPLTLLFRTVAYGALWLKGGALKLGHNRVHK